jgi:hypothetical protein
MVYWDQGRIPDQEVQTSARATDDDSEAWGRRACPGNTDDSGASGVNGRQAGAGADLRGGFKSLYLWLPAEAKRARSAQESTRASL